VNVARARKAGRDLVRKLTSGPERTGAVEELLELCADIPEPRWAPKRQRIRPADVIVGRDSDVGGGVDMRLPLWTRSDRFRAGASSATRRRRT
jgi:hypothetical protein